VRLTVFTQPGSCNHQRGEVVIPSGDREGCSGKYRRTQSALLSDDFHLDTIRLSWCYRRRQLWCTRRQFFHVFLEPVEKGRSVVPGDSDHQIVLTEIVLIVRLARFKGKPGNAANGTCRHVLITRTPEQEILQRPFAVVLVGGGSDHLTDIVFHI